MRRNFSRLALRIRMPFSTSWVFVQLSGQKKKQLSGSKRNKPPGSLMVLKLSRNPRANSCNLAFVKSELSALFNANNKTETNSAAHEIEINDMVASLEYLDIAEISRSAIEMTFDGVKMEGCASKVSGYYHPNGYTI